jgi:hypothetical protein
MLFAGEGVNNLILDYHGVIMLFTKEGVNNFYNVINLWCVLFLLLVTFQIENWDT